MTLDGFDSLAAQSRKLHGHMYVLPVAAWILQSETQVVGAREAMAGLGGRADRPRIIEALAKLTEFGALRELPREARKNAPRIFERVEDPYWRLVRAYTAETTVAELSTKGSVQVNSDDVNQGARFDS